MLSGVIMILNGSDLAAAGAFDNLLAETQSALRRISPPEQLPEVCCLYYRGNVGRGSTQWESVWRNETRAFRLTSNTKLTKDLPDLFPQGRDESTGDLIQRFIVDFCDAKQFDRCSVIVGGHGFGPAGQFAGTFGSLEQVLRTHWESRNRPRIQSLPSGAFPSEESERLQPAKLESVLDELWPELKQRTKTWIEHNRLDGIGFEQIWTPATSEEAADAPGLSVPELRAALEGANIISQTLILHSCLMGTFEVGIELKDVTRSIIACEAALYGRMNTETWFSEFRNSNDISARDLAGAIIDAEDCSRAITPTLVAFDTSAVTTVLLSVNEFSRALCNFVEAKGVALIQKARNALHVKLPVYLDSFSVGEVSYLVDMGRFCGQLLEPGALPSSTATLPLQQSAQKLLNQLEASDYRIRLKDGGAGFHGTAIYFPEPASASSRNPLARSYRRSPRSGDQLRIIESSFWDDFLRLWTATSQTLV